MRTSTQLTFSMYAIASCMAATFTNLWSSTKRHTTISSASLAWHLCTHACDWSLPRHLTVRSGSCSHNGAALSVIKASILNLKHATSIAYFDTSFPFDIPQHISSYAINQEVAKRKGLKKYGFHGISCTFKGCGPSPCLRAW